MAIRLVTHRKGGNAADITAIAKRLKTAVLRHGADSFQLSVEIAGPAAGQWVLVINFSDWTSYGRAMAAAIGEPDVQGILTELDKVAEMTGRRLIAEIDI
jgi:hypothetical protein